MTVVPEVVVLVTVEYEVAVVDVVLVKLRDVVVTVVDTEVDTEVDVTVALVVDVTVVVVELAASKV